MSKEVEDILSRIRSDDSESFLGAGKLLRAHIFGLDGTAVLEPYASIYANDPLGDDDVKLLKNSLLKYLRDGNLVNAPSAARALTQLGDSRLIDAFRQLLVERLRLFSLQGYTVGQLLLALGQYGENATPGTSYSSDDFDKNAKDASRYLHSIGIEDI